MFLQKDKQRKEVCIKLNTLSDEKINTYSKQINRHLNSLLEKLEIESLCLFFPFKNEPKLLISDLLSKYPNCYCPKYIKNSYTFSKLNAQTEITQGKFNILEPKNLNRIHKSKIMSKSTVFIVPLIGFDKQGNRLGHGHGVYDRLLKGTIGKKIGIGFSMQEVDKVQSEHHDIALEYVITEKKIFKSHPL